MSSKVFFLTSTTKQGDTNIGIKTYAFQSFFIVSNLLYIKKLLNVVFA
jgi:hypothetical protein